MSTSGRPRAPTPHAMSGTRSWSKRPATMSSGRSTTYDGALDYYAAEPTSPMPPFEQMIEVHCFAPKRQGTIKSLGVPSSLRSIPDNASIALSIPSMYSQQSMESDSVVFCGSDFANSRVASGRRATGSTCSKVPHVKTIFSPQHTPTFGHSFDAKSLKGELGSVPPSPRGHIATPTSASRFPLPPGLHPYPPASARQRNSTRGREHITPSPRSSKLPIQATDLHRAPAVRTRVRSSSVGCDSSTRRRHGSASSRKLPVADQHSVGYPETGKLIPRIPREPFKYDGEHPHLALPHVNEGERDSQVSEWSQYIKDEYNLQPYVDRTVTEEYKEKEMRKIRGRRRAESQSTNVPERKPAPPPLRRRASDGDLKRGARLHAPNSRSETFTQMRDTVRNFLVGLKLLPRFTPKKSASVSASVPTRKPRQKFATVRPGLSSPAFSNLSGTTIQGSERSLGLPRYPDNFFDHSG